jgi:uncharacterized membrane protein YraQ (UPF0718 family)
MPEKLRLIDGNFLALVAVLALLIALAYARGGGELVQQGLRDGGGLLVRFGLVIVVSFLAAGVAQVLIPHEWVNEALGRDSGFRGIALGAAAGIITPSGPFVSMPIAVVLIKSGAAAGPVVAFLTGWAVLALHRLIAWEAPILGWRFALFRWSVCLVLPLVAGLLARALARS